MPWFLWYGMLISMSCLFYGWEVVEGGGRDVGSEKITLCPPPLPPAVGEGGEENNYAFRGRGRGLESFCFWGQVVKKYLERDLQTFTGIVIFRFSFRFWLISLSFFLLFGVFRLHANKAKTKIPTFLLLFALSEYEWHTIVPPPPSHWKCYSAHTIKLTKIVAFWSYHSPIFIWGPDLWDNSCQNEVRIF